MQHEGQDVKVWREGSNVVVEEDGVKRYYECQAWDTDAQRWGDTDKERVWINESQ